MGLLISTSTWKGLGSHHSILTRNKGINGKSMTFLDSLGIEVIGKWPSLIWRGR